MSLKSIPRPLVAGLASVAVTAAVAVGTVFTVAESAQAATSGTLTFNPTTGNGDATISITTSAACPANGTNAVVDMTGPGFPSGFVAVGNSSINLYGGAGTKLTIPLAQTMAVYAQQAGTTLQTGAYTFTATCRAAFNATSLQDFVGTINGTLSGSKWTFAAAGAPSTSSSGTTSPTTSPSTSPSTSSSGSPTTSPTTSGGPSGSTTPTAQAGGGGGGGGTGAGGTGTGDGPAAGTGTGDGTGTTPASTQNVSTDLAKTGSSDFVPLAATGATALVTGTAAVWWSRRRRPSDSSSD